MEMTITVISTERNQWHENSLGNIAEENQIWMW